jgi:hypothetical protein
MANTSVPASTANYRQVDRCSFPQRRVPTLLQAACITAVKYNNKTKRSPINISIDNAAPCFSGYAIANLRSESFQDKMNDEHVMASGLALDARKKVECQVSCDR